MGHSFTVPEQNRLPSCSRGDPAVDLPDYKTIVFVSVFTEICDTTCFGGFSECYLYSSGSGGGGGGAWS